MISWAVGGVFVLLVVIVAAGVGAVSAVFGGGGADGCRATVTNPGATPDGLTAEQASNAAVIVAVGQRPVGQRMSVPPRGWVIAVATALQESNLINIGGGPDDSLGLFQQRPSQGWGTPEQIMNPDYAAGKFYERLLAVPGWQTMPLTEAAQRVQKSAYPNAYAKHEARATEIVSAYTGGTLPVCDGAAISASGWTRPVAGTVGSGFRTADRPGHDGVDIMAARGTVIHAASGGVVVRVRCNIAGNSWDGPFSSPMPCDRDGYPGLGGCGWYAEIRHAGDIVSRYCHMVRQPSVQVGQTVAPGTPIGFVGTSGNSSGPHLHFEIHTSNPASSTNAINPVPFMIEHGAPL